MPVDKPYIQLLHAGSIHWVRISDMKTNKCDNGTHYIYDIMYKARYCKKSYVLFVP